LSLISPRVAFPLAAFRVGRSAHRGKALVEGVAGAADGADGVDVAGAAVDRLAQAADMHIHRALIDIDIAPPDTVEQLPARIDAAGMAHEVFEQAVLGGPQMQLAAAAAHAVAGAVDLEIAG